MLGLGLCYPRYRLLVLLPIILVAASRLILFAHYLSDVMAGFLLSAWIVPRLYVWFSPHYHKLLPRLRGTPRHA